jgi:uncharacterized protein
MILGTLVNVAAVLAGGTIGLLVHSRLPARFTKIVFQGIGLFTMFLGVSLALKTSNYLVMIFSLVIGAILGELMQLDLHMERLGDRLKKLTGGKTSRFSEGFVTAFLLFCMGSMTVLGAFEEGLGGQPNLLFAKSLLDGISSIALAAALGLGVLFSVIPLLLYQGGLTLLAVYMGNLFSETVINELTAVGGILLIGLGINILEISKLKILNMIPSLLIAVILAYFFL